MSRGAQHSASTRFEFWPGVPETAGEGSVVPCSGSAFPGQADQPGQAHDLARSVPAADRFRGNGATLCLEDRAEGPSSGNPQFWTSAD